MARRSGAPEGNRKENKMKRTVQLFHKTVNEGKSVVQAAKEMGISKVSAHKYKKTEEYRQMALASLDGQIQGGVQGAVSKLVEALDAERPEVLNTVTEKNGKKSIRSKIEMVADNQTRMKALEQIVRIYGLHAPIKKDVTVGISISSDEELFGQIESASRACKYVESQQVGERSSIVVDEQSGLGSGDDHSRGRALLQDAAISEPEQRGSELAVSDHVGCPEVEGPSSMRSEQNRKVAIGSLRDSSDRNGRTPPIRLS